MILEVSNKYHCKLDKTLGNFYFEPNLWFLNITKFSVLVPIHNIENNLTLPQRRKQILRSTTLKIRKSSSTKWQK